MHSLGTVHELQMKGGLGYQFVSLSTAAIIWINKAPVQASGDRGGPEGETEAEKQNQGSRMINSRDTKDHLACTFVKENDVAIKKRQRT